MNHLLVVDDEPGICLLMQAMLVRQGYEVSTAESVEEVLNLIPDDSLNLVICDINLPKSSGLELLSEFQSIQPDVPFVVMTGDPSVGNTVQALRDGAFDYLLKPIDENLLLNTVAKGVAMKKLKHERDRLERLNAQHRECLEKRVEQRTDELKKIMMERDRMQQSLIRQERLNALGTMSTIIAHDIRNLLTPITLYCETIKIKEKNITPESVGFLDLIQSTAGDIESITKRIRDLSKGPESSSDEAVCLSPHTLIDRAIELCWAKKEAHTRGKSIDLEMISQVSPDLPAIQVNPSEIIESLINLTFNSIDALPDGGTVELKAYSDDRHVYLEVVDNGIGMEPSVKSRCVEPFFSTKGERGTGLGLSSVHGIVDSNNGVLTIESEHGRGTCVRMAFPMVPALMAS